MRSRPRRSPVLLVAAGLLGAGVLASATTVIPPTFTELVDQAQIIFVGEVVQTQAQWVTSPSRAIVTRVTYRVDKVLKGQLGAMTMLEFVGGQIGEDRLEVAGMPRFRISDRDLLFVDERGHPVSPIVGFMHGRFRLTRDPRTGRDLVNRYNYSPLASVDELGKVPSRLPTARVQTMTLDDFEAEITRALRRPSSGR